MADMGDFVATHRGLVIGGGLILVLVVAGKMLTNRSAATSTVNGPLSSFGNPITGPGGTTTYVPTSTTFTTNNQGQFSNDPLLKTVTSSGNTTTTSTSTTTTNKPPPPTTQPPATIPPPPRVPPQPVPPPRTKSLIWDQGYTVSSGQTLSYIASVDTRNCRAQGMPTSLSVVWHDVYAHNQSTIDALARQHGFTSNPWDWIFPGEHLTIARWG